MIYNGASGRAGVSMPSIMDEQYLSAKTHHLAVRMAAKACALWFFTLMTLQVVFNFLRLIWLALPWGRQQCLRDMSFGEWREHSVPRGMLARCFRADDGWRVFTEEILVPLFSAVCTAGEADVGNHPVEEFLGMSDSIVRLVALYSHTSLLHRAG